MDPLTLVASISPGLVKDLIKEASGKIGRKFELPEREKALDSCIQQAKEALVSSFQQFDKKDQKRLEKLLNRF